MSETDRSIQVVTGVVAIICTVGWGLLGGVGAGSVSTIIGDLIPGGPAVPIMGGSIVIVGLAVVSLVRSDLGTDPVTDIEAIPPEVPNPEPGRSKQTNDWNSRWEGEDEV